MKFWKILSYLILQTLPDWRDKFLSYKDLKKQLKLIYPSSNHDHGYLSPSKRPRLSYQSENRDSQQNDLVSGTQEIKEVSDFVRLLEVEIDKFNSFVVDKEEEYVIRWKELQDRLTEARHSNEDLMQVEREIVDLHGEMVLLENYSALNYTGLVKIIKKYDKRSGALIRLPFIQKVLQEPFYANDTLFKLVKESEATLDRLFSQNKPSASSQVAENDSELNTGNSNEKENLFTADKELAEIEQMESMYMKLTLSALRALKEIRSGSSTVSEFSLPPMESSLFEEKTRAENSVVEQVTK